MRLGGREGKAGGRGRGAPPPAAVEPRGGGAQQFAVDYLYNLL